MLRDEQIDYVFAALIDDRGDGLAVNVIQTPAKKGEAFRGQIDDRRSKVDPAVEPRLDEVTIAGLDLSEMTGLERMNRRRYDFLGYRLLLIPADHCEDEAGRSRRRKHRAHRKSAEEGSPGWLHELADRNNARCRCRRQGFDAVAQ